MNIEAGVTDEGAYFSVSDNGCGIPEKYKDRIFDPDFTLKPGTGTWLGLAIVKYLCEQRRAKINLETSLNHGTKIKIVTPSIIGGAYV